MITLVQTSKTQKSQLQFYNFQNSGLQNLQFNLLIWNTGNSRNAEVCSQAFQYLCKTKLEKKTFILFKIYYLYYLLLLFIYSIPDF